MNPSRPLATISIDLDNLWCYQRSFGLKTWLTYPSFLAIALPRIIAYLDQHKLKITAFIIGRDAENEQLQPLLKQLAKAGHEIANHSFDHSINLHWLTKSQIRDDVVRAERAIHLATGNKPVGFRGPAFGVSLPLLETLSELGYQYDSSSLPNTIGMLARRYHRIQANSLSAEVDLNESLYGSFKECLRPLRPYQWILSPTPLMEQPITTMPLLRLPFHGTYLNYLADRSETLAYYYYRVSISLCEKMAVAPSLLLHATDFLGGDDGIDLSFIPGMQRTSKHKMAFMSKVLNHYCTQFKVMPIKAYTDSLSHAQLKQYQPIFD